MRQRKIALTGPAAASAYALDGFREQLWPVMWCAPISSDSAPRLIRVRDWKEPDLVDDVLVAPMATVLRHLNAVPDDLLGRPDGLEPIERVELAVEHALRLGIVPTVALGGRQTGDALLRKIVNQRRGEPPTESYAETRAAQLLRTRGSEPWRQIAIGGTGPGSRRADFMIPFRPGPRPAVIRPDHGLLIEIDSREFHEGRFEEDHHRGSAYDALGYHWIAVTPNQVEKRPAEVLQSVEGALRRHAA
jgi:hypothetical protein